nr:hypothetical protein [Tanacetum cinerariifolium]
QEKKAKLFNEWERFTSNEGESIESYYDLYVMEMISSTKIMRISEALQYWALRRSFRGLVAFFETISAGDDGSERENARWGVVVAPSGGVFRDRLSHGSP